MVSETVATGSGPGGGSGGIGIEVTRADERHDAALADFFRRVWDSNATAETVARGRLQSARSNPVTPGREAPRFIVLREGRVIGYVGTIPVLARCGQDSVPGHWIKGLMVVPEHRNGPVGFTVLREAIRSVGEGWTFALAVEIAPRRLFEALGFADLGVVPEYMRLLRPRRIFEILGRKDLEAPIPAFARRVLRFVRRVGGHRAVGWLTAVGVRFWSRAVGSPGPGLVGRESKSLDAGGLARIRDAMGPNEYRWTPAERSHEYLNRRYGGDESYRYGIVDSANGPEAMVILRRPGPAGSERLGGIRVGTISELMYPGGLQDRGLAALQTAEALAMDAGADAALCSGSDPELRRILLRRGYLPVPSRMHFLVRGPGGQTKGVPKLSSWWITRGDSGTDEVF